jgi:hypothetical protein
VYQLSAVDAKTGAGRKKARIEPGLNPPKEEVEETGSMIAPCLVLCNIDLPFEGSRRHNVGKSQHGAVTL